MNITQEKQIHWYREQTSGYKWVRRAVIGVGGWEVQSTGCKTGSRCIVQLGQYSQHCVITVSGKKSLKLYKQFLNCVKDN